MCETPSDSKRKIYYTADVVTPDGSDTSIFGDPCLEGQGATLTQGWISPDRDRTLVYDTADDVAPDVWDEGDGDPVGWLAGQLSERLVAVDDVGATGTVYAAGSDTDPVTGVSVTLAAHPRGFTRREIDRALTMIRGGTDASMALPTGPFAGA